MLRLTSSRPLKGTALSARPLNGASLPGLSGRGFLGKGGKRSNKTESSAAMKKAQKIQQERIRRVHERVQAQK